MPSVTFGGPYSRDKGKTMRKTAVQALQEGAELKIVDGPDTIALASSLFGEKKDRCHPRLIVLMPDGERDAVALAVEAVFRPVATGCDWGILGTVGGSAREDDPPTSVEVAFSIAKNEGNIKNRT